MIDEDRGARGRSPQSNYSRTQHPKPRPIPCDHTLAGRFADRRVHSIPEHDHGSRDKPRLRPDEYTALGIAGQHRKSRATDEKPAEGVDAFTTVHAGCREGADQGRRPDLGEQ